jgi:hypothetical protein
MPRLPEPAKHLPASAFFPGVLDQNIGFLLMHRKEPGWENIRVCNQNY